MDRILEMLFFALNHAWILLKTGRLRCGDADEADLPQLCGVIYMSDVL